MSQELAIKRILSPFTTAEHAKRSFREVAILALTQLDVVPGTNTARCTDIVKLKYAYTDALYQELYLTMEIAQGNLHQSIQSGTLQEPHIQYIMYQLLRGERVRAFIEDLSASYKQG